MAKREALLALSPAYWPVAVVYLGLSLFAGYMAVSLGLRLGAGRPTQHHAGV